jgi:uncharacterized protein
MQQHIIGRFYEKERLGNYIDSQKSEFIAVYGRRRIGKTYLVEQYFENKFTFYHTGLANASTKEQLVNFGISLKKYFPLAATETPKDWYSAILYLIENLEKLPPTQKIIFIDELPWLDTKASKLITAIEYFWNSWASGKKDVKFIVCGSAASWIINKLLNNRGGLHNRVTCQIKLNPFTLNETKLFLESKNCRYDNYQIVHAYMVFGGIPFYLEQFNKQWSVAQNINHLCFGDNAAFTNEYLQLFKSLFNNYEKHIAVVEAIASKNKGCSRDDILKKLKVADGGGLSIILKELEESNFIRKYPSWQKKSREAIYQMIDNFSLFYLKFMANANNLDTNFWLNSLNTPKYLTWGGYAFEIVCLQHLPQIKAALGIAGVLTNTAAWYSKEAQIDLLIDRADKVVNMVEIKFSTSAYLITKNYDEVLRNKMAMLKNYTKTNRAIWVVMLTTYGLKQGMYNGNVHSQIMMDDLFG